MRREPTYYSGMYGANQLNGVTGLCFLELDNKAGVVCDHRLF